MWRWTAVVGIFRNGQHTHRCVVLFHPLLTYRLAATRSTVPTPRIAIGSIKLFVELREGCHGKGFQRGAGRPRVTRCRVAMRPNRPGMPDAGIRAQPIRPAQKNAAGSRDLPVKRQTCPIGHPIDGQTGRPDRTATRPVHTNGGPDRAPTSSIATAGPRRSRARPSEIAERIASATEELASGVSQAATAAGSVATRR